MWSQRLIPLNFGRLSFQWRALIDTRDDPLGDRVNIVPEVVHKHPASVRKILIYPNQELRIVSDIGNVLEVIEASVHGAWDVWKRCEWLELLCDRANQGGRNLVVRKRSPCSSTRIDIKGIVELHRDSREVSLPLCRRRHDERLGTGCAHSC